MPPVTIYGSKTCEDTALVRDHLRALGIPFQERDREDDPDVPAILARYNAGRMVTPTLIFGRPTASDHEAVVMSEPTPAALENALRQAGYAFKPLRAVESRDLASRPAPDFKLPTTDGGEFELHKLRGRDKTALFFAHGPDCLACRGYARQLTAHAGAVSENGAQLVLVLPEDVETARRWSQEFARGLPVVADAGGEIKRAYADYFSADRGGVMLLILDSYTAPRAGSFAAESGGLVIPEEVVAWLRLLDSECAE